MVAAQGGGYNNDDKGMRQGVAATTRERTVAAATTVGLLPQPSVSSHSRGSSLLSFFKSWLGFVGGSLPLL